VNSLLMLENPREDCVQELAKDSVDGARMSRPLRLVPEAAQSIEFSCPLCGSVHAAYIFGKDQFRIYRCAGCALTFSMKPPRRLAVTASPEGAPFQKIERSERHHIGLLAAIDSAAIGGPVLVVADPNDRIVGLLEQRGMTIGRVAGPEDLGPGDWGASYQAAVVSDALMRVADPRASLLKVHKHLAKAAPLILSVPLLDGYQARLMGRNWHEWQATNLWYFTRETLNLLLLSAGFEHVWFRSERRSYSLENLVERLSRSAEEATWLPSVKALHWLSPPGLRRQEFPLPSGTAVVTAAAAPRPSECTVSIIVPVYNERATLETMLDALLAKKLPGLRKEIIIVESNSIDGSRELVQSFESHHDVRIVLQPKPRGKGNAVREGLKSAIGDIVMIQDADLEYDLDDYDGLLAPILSWQAMFILGSRHQGGWKMRKFNDAPVTAAVFNLAHWGFKSLMNFLLNTRMTDPFTMFKVFRRDALFGVDFICNRFDFDIELVMKLVRKGYVPVELPVNYLARSFAEGKKVSVTRDGLTWIWTILRARFSPLTRF
jgi:hypothetical protein